jgi:hypothetical protein
MPSRALHLATALVLWQLQLWSVAAGASPDPAPVFVPPSGFASLNDFCSRGLSPLSDAQLEALYAAAAPVHLRTGSAAPRGAERRVLSDEQQGTMRARAASSETAAPVDDAAAAAAAEQSLAMLLNATAAGQLLRTPRGCTQGCILRGHGTAVLAPNVQNLLWSGKCFHPGGDVQNYGWTALPRLTGSMWGTYEVGPSVGPASVAGGEDAVLIRYPPGGPQNLVAALFTGGFLGTGADDLSDFLDEVRELPGLPGAPCAAPARAGSGHARSAALSGACMRRRAAGLFLGITYVADDAAGGDTSSSSLHVALWFVLVQTQAGLEQYEAEMAPRGALLS